MAPDRLVIRTATDLDLLGLLGIRPDEFLHRERLERQERGLVTCLVAAHATGPVLGYVLLKWQGEEDPVMEDLIVRPDYQGRGIGTRLISYAENLCCQRGLARLGLRVNPANNPRAKALYERLGYADTGEAPQYDVYARTDENGERHLYEDWCIQMAKELVPLPSRLSGQRES